MSEHERELIISAYHLAGIAVAFGAVNIILGLSKLFMMVRVVTSSAEDRRVVRMYARLIQQYAALYSRGSEDVQRSVETAAEKMADAASRVAKEKHPDDQPNGGAVHIDLTVVPPGMSNTEFGEAMGKMIRDADKGEEPDAGP
jgi:hypothetical protein